MSENSRDKIGKVKKEKAKEVFERGNFNFEMYKYALEDYFRKKEEKKKDSEPEKIVETKKSKSWMS